MNERDLQEAFAEIVKQQVYVWVYG
jgi:hypothetical protein